MKKIENNSTFTGTKQPLAIENTYKLGSTPTITQDLVTINSNALLVSTTSYDRSTNIDKVSAEKFINYNRAKVACKTVISEWGEENFNGMVSSAIAACNNVDELSELWAWTYKENNTTCKAITQGLPIKNFLIQIANNIQQKIDQKLIKSSIKFKNKESEIIFNSINKKFKDGFKYEETLDEREKTYEQIQSKYTNALIAFNNGNFNLGNSLIKDFLKNFETFFEFSEQESRLSDILLITNAIKLLNYNFQDHYIDKFEKFFEGKDDEVNTKYAILIATLYVDNYELDKAKLYVQKLENFYQNLDIEQRLIKHIGALFSNFAEKSFNYGNLSQSKEYYYKNWKILTDNKLIAKDKYTKNLNHDCLLDKDNINFKEQINSWFYEASQRLMCDAIKTGDQSYCQEIINYFNGTDIGTLLNYIYSSTFDLSKADIVSISNVNEKNIPSQLQSFLIPDRELTKKFVKFISEEVKKETLTIDSAIELLIGGGKVGDARAFFDKIPEDQIEKNIKLLQQSIYLADDKKSLYRKIESYDLAPQPKSFLHFKAAEKFLSKHGKALEHINRAIELYPGNESYQLLKQMIIISTDKSKAEPELLNNLNRTAPKADLAMPISIILAETSTEKNMEEYAYDEHILDDEGEAYYQDTANNQKKLHQHEQTRKKQEQVFLSNQNVKPKQKVLTIAGEDILHSQTTEVIDIRGIRHRVYIAKSVLETLGAESEQFLSAMSKGFVKPKGKNGIVYHGKNLIKVKTQSDTRIFTDKIYVTPEGISYIIFDKVSNNHKETNRIARASTIETIDIKIDNNQKA